MAATGVLEIVNRTGDTKLEWDKLKEGEVAAARTMFDSLVRDKKYAAYKVKSDGSKGEIIRSFDPDAQRIILAPPIVGG